MRIHRFIADFDLKRGKIKISDLELLKQWRTVLRFKAGDKIILSDGKLNEAEAEIKAIEKNSAEVEILRVYKNKQESANKVILYCSVLKRENFELVAQKATEIGVKEIVPLIAERTVKIGLNRSRLEKIIKEAAEQSGRGIIPILHEPVKFEAAIEQVKQNKLNIFFDKSGMNLNSLTLFPNPYSLSPIFLFIGPEGGWREPELNAAREAGFKIVSLGKLTLRSETAAIIVSYLVQI